MRETRTGRLVALQINSERPNGALGSAFKPHDLIGVGLTGEQFGARTFGRGHQLGGTQGTRLKYHVVGIAHCPQKAAK